MGQGWSNKSTSSSSGVKSVTGLNTDNIDPENPIVQISVDGTTITGDGTPASPLQANFIPTTNYGLFAQTANSTPITSGTETSIIGNGVGTLSVPENGFSVGGSFRADFGGIMSCKNNETLTIKIKSGTTDLSISPLLQMPLTTNQVWLLNINFTVRKIGGLNTASIVVLSELHVLKLASGTQQGFGWNTINATTFDTTILNTLDVTFQWGSNSPATNSIYSDIFVLNKIY
jgi:hypothetical protein